ncbi:MAG: putative phosphoribosyl transferase [Microbacteriaceae bacterium]|jgi:predicted phosphoribosyltransferase|nr:putative phosphoribosyl transferase [Microbacteriaceae bacterium]
MRFRDRDEAGRLLAERLTFLRGRQPVVLGLPRGGVPVAALVAEALDAELDVLVVRKLGAPGRAEFAIGAIGEDGSRFIDERSIRLLGVTPERLEALEHAERAELERRVHDYRQGRHSPDLSGRTAVVIDDGVATGATAVVASRAARSFGAARVVVAVPVAPAAWEWTLAGEADLLVAVTTPLDFVAVGQWYADFRQTTDEEVRALLAAHPTPGR